MPLKRLFPSTVLVVVLAVVLWLGLVVLLVTGVSDPTTMVPVLAVATGMLLVLLYGVQRWGRVRRWAYRSQALAGSLDSSHRACLIVSPDGEEIYANRAARDVFGPAHAPLEPLQARAGNNEYSLGELKRLAAAAMAGGRRRSELPLMVDGEIRDWLLVEVRPVDHKGSVAWLAEDVSARYALEATLHREVEELYDFLDLLPVGCYAATSDGQITTVNYRLAEWLGQSATALVGRNLRDVFGVLPDLEDPHTDLHLAGGKGERFRATALHSIYGRGGILHSRSVVIRALMPEQERNRALWQAEHRFRRLFDDAPTGIALVDQRGIITAANLALQAILGTDSSVLVGDPFTLYVAKDQRTLAEQTLGKIIGGSRVGEHLEVRLTGQKDINAQVFFSPLCDDDDSEQNLGAIIHCVDTTDHRLLEIQFAQSQKMQAMGQLAGGIAHDFNNLLTAIIGNCDLLLQRHRPGDPSFADIMQIQNTSRRAAALVQQLLAFSRRQALQPRPLDVTATLADLSTMLRRLLGERISLHINHGRQLGLVRVDPVRFDQVILNLAVNARDAMLSGGILTIRTSLVMVDRPIQRGSETMPAGHYVLVEVTDTGTGIPREHLSRIFEPFFSTKEVGKGTGLGLSTVYGIIRQTGGFVFVASEEGRGTCFSIYLPQISALDSEAPTHDPEQTAQISASPSSSSSAGPSPLPNSDDLFSVAAQAAAVDLTGSATVLLVEDEDAVRMFSSRALRSKGYTVLEAASAEQALSMLDNHDTIDILVSDVVMPGMDGVSLARHVRRSRPQIRVILISGYSEDMARNGLDPDDGIGFLPKPFSLKQLAQAVKTALES